MNVYHISAYVEVILITKDTINSDSFYIIYKLILKCLWKWDKNSLWTCRKL